jgi:hypothetical protein
VGEPERFKLIFVNNISLPIMTKLSYKQPVSNIVIKFICFGQNKKIKDRTNKS